MITQATGIKPYFVGKPNPLNMRSALNAIDAHSETAIMVGDRMDTDVVSGMEAGMRTILVLTGSTRADEVERFPTGQAWWPTPSRTWSSWWASSRLRSRDVARSARAALRQRTIVSTVVRVSRNW